MLEQASDQGEEYQVILVDWNIPGMKGIETARRMRKVLPEHTPILLLSAFDWEEIREEALEAGISGFLAKPFFVSAFKEKLMELFAEQSDKGEYEKLCEEGGLEGRRFLVAEDNEINAEILSELLDIEEAVCVYIARLVEQSRVHESVQLGISPRGSVAIAGLAKACAFLNGRDYVVPSDIQEILYETMNHRLVLNARAKVNKVTARDVIADIIKAVAVPGLKMH